MAKAKARVHKVVVEIVSSCPVEEHKAINALQVIMKDLFHYCFIFPDSFTPRYYIRSQLKSFNYAAGKYQEKRK